MNFLAPYWEHPATTWCAHCGQPINLTWSNSAIGHHIYHADCYKTHEKETGK